MEERFDPKKNDPLQGRLFAWLCLLSALAFVSGCFFFFSSPSAFSQAEFTRQRLDSFFSPAASPSAFSFAAFGELKFLLILFLGGFTSAAPMWSFAIPALRAFSAGFAACALPSAAFGRFPFLIFTLFFAFTLAIEAHASSLSCLYALLRKREAEEASSLGNAPPFFIGRLSYAARFLTPIGLTLLLSLAKEGLLLLL